MADPTSPPQVTLAGPPPVGRPVAPPPVRRRPVSLARGLVRTARPRQWAKNLLVFAAPGAAGVLTSVSVLSRALATFGLFCLAASGAYFLNDAVDREVDRRHRTKQHRPVAAGIVPERLAVAAAAVLLPASVALGLLVNTRVAAALAVYVGVNLAYDLWLRQEHVLELAAVASGFVIRAVAGGLATGVRLSEWFLVVTSFASLFVVAGKREATVPVVATGTGPVPPPTAARPGARVTYPAAFLRYVRALASGVAITAYCLWAFDKASAAAGRGVWFELTAVPFVLAILRFALLVEQGRGDPPEDLLLGDRTIVVMVVAWAALFAVGVYGS
ncbi:MAG: decaprenyl-phosphate phosphoribosyltransferase [Acidimicrobiales bacterium]